MKNQIRENSWNKCLRIFFYVIFDVEFDSDTPEIIYLPFRIDFMRFHEFDIMCPTLTEMCSSRSSRIVTPLCEQEDMIKFFANRCRYSTLHCFITMKITKTWHDRTDFHEKWRFFEGPQTSDKHSENCIESFSPMETLPEARTNFFLTPKIYDLELQRTRTTSRSTAVPEFMSDMESTYLEL